MHVWPTYDRGRAAQAQVVIKQLDGIYMRAETSWRRPIQLSRLFDINPNGKIMYLEKNVYYQYTIYCNLFKKKRLQ